ncbi:MAG: DEAD/DEAH box helicase [Nanobdellota archaeon]
MKFQDLNLSKHVLKAIHNLGYEQPTLIQEKSIPLIMSNHDILGESATGSGKTLAFSAGIIEKVVPGKGVQALILTPTRELADQIKDEILIMIKGSKTRITTVYGGVSIEPQIKKIASSDIVVATPGRMKDHIGRRTINLNTVNTVVLDEADRMLEMGFIEDVEDILKECPKQRQSLCFSATFPPKITHLAKKYLHDPKKITAKKQVDPSKLSQYYYDVSKGLKFSLLAHLLKNEEADLVMIFCNTRNTVDFVVTNLREQGISATAIHGGFSQNKRTNTLDRFKDGKKTVLVCTDVAARGIHVDDVSHIYNYEIPRSPTDYVHRIGRTARAGEEGKVINLICDLDYENFSKVFNEFKEFEIEKIEKPYVENVPVKKVIPQRKPFSKRNGRKGGSRGNRGGPRNSRGGSRGGRDGPKKFSGRSQGNRGASRSNRGNFKGRNSNRQRSPRKTFASNN